MARSWALAASTLVVLGAPLGAQALAPGEPAPDIRLPTLGGPETSLAALRGRPVLVNFWASWCGPCREEMPLIVAAYEAHRRAGLQVLAVNLRDQEEHGRDVERFVAQFQLPFPVLLDQRGRIRRRYQVAGVPTSVFVDAGGAVRVVHPGPITQEALARGLALILRVP